MQVWSFASVIVRGHRVDCYKERTESVKPGVKGILSLSFVLAYESSFHFQGISIVLSCGLHCFVSVRSIVQESEFWVKF